MNESNPRWMTRTGLVLLLAPLAYNLWYVFWSFTPHTIYVKHSIFLTTLNCCSVMGMILMLPEFRSRLAPLASLFLIMLLPLFSFSNHGSSSNLMLALVILMIGVACMVYTVGGSSGLYFIIGCLSSWLFALASYETEIRQSRNLSDDLLRDVSYAVLAFSLGLASMMIQRFVTQLLMVKQPNDEQPINNS